jgi:hypothetical protein
MYQLYAVQEHRCGGHIEGFVRIVALRLQLKSRRSCGEHGSLNFNAAQKYLISLP